MSSQTTYKVGDTLMVADRLGYIVPAVVIDVKDDDITVQYWGWVPSNNDTLPGSSPRIKYKGYNSKIGMKSDWDERMLGSTISNPKEINNGYTYTTPQLTQAIIDLIVKKSNSAVFFINVDEAGWNYTLDDVVREYFLKVHNYSMMASRTTHDEQPVIRLSLSFGDMSKWTNTNEDDAKLDEVSCSHIFV